MVVLLGLLVVPSGLVVEGLVVTLRRANVLLLIVIAVLCNLAVVSLLAQP